MRKVSFLYFIFQFYPVLGIHRSSYVILLFINQAMTLCTALLTHSLLEKQKILLNAI